MSEQKEKSFVESMKEDRLKITGILILILIFVAALVFILSDIGFVDPDDRIENVTLVTEDGWEISATHFDGDERGVVLIHMLNQDDGRLVWNDTARKLNEKGFSVMTIDLRGHGESKTREGETEETSWREFESDYGQESWDTEFKKMRFELKEAVDYLEEENQIETLGLVGADIGSNIAAFYTDYRDADTLVLLSPGTINTYHRGIPIMGQVQNYEKPILFVVSEDTGHQYSMTELFYMDSPSDTKEVIEFEDAGRGTRMMEAEPELEQDIIDWLDEYL